MIKITPSKNAPYIKVYFWLKMRLFWNCEDFVKKKLEKVLTLKHFSI